MKNSTLWSLNNLRSQQYPNWETHHEVCQRDIFNKKQKSFCHRKLLLAFRPIEGSSRVRLFDERKNNTKYARDINDVSHWNTFKPMNWRAKSNRHLDFSVSFTCWVVCISHRQLT